jgi:hypothetical protein
VDEWSVKNFYIGAWPLILAAIVGLPLLVYGVVRGIAAVSLWSQITAEMRIGKGNCDPSQ